jgi:tetratricopeptide (TPR) repeat protein
MTKLKVVIFTLILLFYGFLAVHKIDLVTGDAGLHLQNGEMVLQGNFDVLTKNLYSYSEPNYRYINDHWLSGVIFLLIYKISGFGGMILFTAVILLLTFFLIFWIAKKRSDFWLATFFSIPAILILSERTDARPEIFSYLFVALFIYLLFDLEEHPEHKRIFWLIPIQLLWVNLHIFFIVGFALVGGFLIEKIILNYKNLKDGLLVRKLLLLLGLLILVSFINPNGARGVLYPLNRYNEQSVHVNEVQPILSYLQSKPVEDISIIIFIPLALLLVTSFFFGFKRAKKPIFYLLASMGATYIGFSIVRTLPFFGLIFLPAISENFSGVFIKLKEWLKQKPPKTESFLRKALIFSLIILFPFLLFWGAKWKTSSDGFGLGLTPRANDAAAFFKAQNLKGPIFNDMAIGNYLIYSLYPQEKVFFDNRHADSYSPEFLKEYKTMLTEEEAWQKALEKYNFNTIFFYHYDEVFNARQFLSRRMHDSSWVLVYVDNNNAILLRNNTKNKEIINQFQITGENVGEKLAFLVNSEDVNDWIAVADILNLMGYKDQALTVFQEVVLKQPKNSKIWRIMGETAVLKNSEKSDTLAIIYLKRAIELGQKNDDSYTYIGLAQLRLGKFEEAKLSLEKALRLNPGRKDAQDYLAKVKEYLK